MRQHTTGMCTCTLTNFFSGPSKLYVPVWSEKNQRRLPHSKLRMLHKQRNRHSTYFRVPSEISKVIAMASRYLLIFSLLQAVHALSTHKSGYKLKTSETTAGTASWASTGLSLVQPLSALHSLETGMANTHPCFGVSGSSRGSSVKSR